ncbi:hypothetical protein BJ741DRAFT_599486 [Chytriomyces cf. hyalinus JEL632]|nr:hypothetical protein BJ741DRAFT_599486 [Chytriomyces cf. hyalinus JEL632]
MMGLGVGEKSIAATVKTGKKKTEIPSPLTKIVVFFCQLRISHFGFGVGVCVRVGKYQQSLSMSIRTCVRASGLFFGHDLFMCAAVAVGGVCHTLHLI